MRGWRASPAPRWWPWRSEVNLQPRSLLVLVLVLLVVDSHGEDEDEDEDERSLIGLEAID
jgi:hypothetical protein